MQKKKCRFNLAMEEFKDNKALVTKLKNRYSKNRYDEEVKKYDALKSVYRAIENDSLTPFDAANLLVLMTLTGASMMKKKNNAREYQLYYYQEGDVIPEVKS